MVGGANVEPPPVRPVSISWCLQIVLQLLVFHVRPRDATNWKAQFYYFTQGTDVPNDLDERQVDASADVNVIDYPSTTSAWVGVTQADNFAARWATTLTVLTASEYVFTLSVADGARVVVDKTELSSLLTINSYQTVSRTIYLAAGQHDMLVEFFETDGIAGLKLEYQGPDTGSALKKVCEVASSCTAKVPNAAPVITLTPPNPIYVLQGASFSDPGYLCNDADGALGAPLQVDRFPPDPQTLVNALGNHTVNYTCEDTDGYKVTKSRSVIVRGPPVVTLKGASTIEVPLGTVFNDNGACCVDFEGVELPVNVFGTVNTNIAGKYPVAYQCSDNKVNGVTVSVTRSVIVDKAPEMALLGGISVKTVKGMGYEDEGLLCQDVEDGFIHRRKADNVERLHILQTTTSDINAGTAGATDGRTDGHCGSVVEVSAGDPRWIRFDLGDVRVVYHLKLYSPSAGWMIHVGSEADVTAAPPGQGSCTLSDATQTAVDWQVVACASPRAGRYVTVFSPASAGILSLVDAEVWGTAGPANPSKFKIDGCPDYNFEFVIKGDSGGFPTYADSSVVASNSVLATLSFSNKQWLLKNSASTTLAVGNSAGPLVDAIWFSNVAPSCIPELDFTAADACTWLFGFSNQNGYYQCSDGTECIGVGCCAEVARCPKDAPQLCRNPDSQGHYVCATDCASKGGPRICGVDAPGSMDCFETSTMYTPDMSPSSTESSTEACQLKCQNTMDCARWSLETSNGVCHLHDTSSTKSTAVGFTAGPKSCVPRYYSVGSVDQTQPGFHNIFFSCVDSLGQRVGLSRTIEVSCEGPNPGGVYGGNKLSCEANVSSAAATDSDECAKKCIDNPECEAFEFEVNTCLEWKVCDGRYYTDANEFRQVGYCQRKDHPPKTILDDAPCCVNLGEEWAEAPYSCVDLEDPVPPTPAKTTTLNTAVPGVYAVHYSCTDKAGQSSTDYRNVTVKARCAVPQGIPDAHANGPCVEGNADIPHGSTCTPQCGGGTVPTKSKITCVSDSDLNYTSHWDELFACGDSPCTAPNVAHVADGAHGPLSCKDATWSTEFSAYLLPSGVTCTPNCKADGLHDFVPTEPGLACDKGQFVPATFQCRLPAAKPDYVLFGKPTPLEVDVQWAGGAGNDCIFKAWELRARHLTEEGDDSIWFEPSGCSGLGSVAGREGDTTCTAAQLLEGETYDFRVREICEQSDLYSPWQVSQNVTMKRVEPPVPIFSIPVDDVKENPAQFLVAYSVPCVPSVNAFNTSKLNVTRFGDHCSKESWLVSAPNVSTNGLSGSGAELTGGRILIIVPPPVFLAKGCTFIILLDEGFIQTKEQPAKPSPEMGWNFTYIDVRPELQFFTKQDVGQTHGTFMLRWTETTRFTCTAFPRDLVGCSLEAAQSPAKTRDKKCLNVSLPYELLQITVEDPVTFVIEGLYPGTQYMVACSGYKVDGVDKWWVTTLPVSETQAESMKFDTAEDTDSSLAALYINVTANCADGSTPDPTRTFTMQQTELDSPLTVQMADYSKACNGGKELVEGDTANMSVIAAIAARSPHATATWSPPRGPVINFTYVKPHISIDLILSDYLLFQIFSLAHAANPVTNPPTQYRLDVKTVDVSFNFADLIFNFRRLTAGESNQASIVSQSQILDLPATVSKAGFDWSDVQMSLGSSTEGFELPTQYFEASQSLQFTSHGQGTNLPLFLLWRGASFATYKYVSFEPPLIKLPLTEAAICCQNSDKTLLRFRLENVPDVAALKMLPNPASGGGLDTPANNLQLVVVKRGRNESENLCQGTTFPMIDGNVSWFQPECILSPAALDDIVIMLKIKDFKTKDLELVISTEISGNLSFARPKLKGLSDGGTGAANGDKIDLGGPLSARTLYLDGSGFPRTMDLEMRGAKFNGYRVYLELGSETVDFCEAIEWVNDANLSCTMFGCLNLSAAKRFPNLRLFLGDLSTKDALSNTLALPRPYIIDFGPKAILDVGPNQSMWFIGKYFGETGCSTLDSGHVHLIGRSSGATILVGNALCNVLFQNDTYIDCVVRDQVMNPRNPGNGGVPSLIRHSEQTITFYGALGVDQDPDRDDFKAFNGNPVTGAWPSEPPYDQELAKLAVAVSLSPCPDGQRRSAENSHICVKCPRGRWITNDQEEWPLTCKLCPDGKYQDMVGATACKNCPANTETREGADALSDCVCKPGYYSPYLNTTSGSSATGTTCIACHSVDMTQEPLKTDKCGSELPVADFCDVHSKPVCVNEAPPAIAFRVCRAYCPGGSVWPKAKSSFWLLENRAGTVGELGLTKYEPTFVRCDPLESCLPHNKCEKMYEGSSCGKCIPFYWRDAATNLCNPCGAEQEFGMIVMSAMLVLLSVGGLFGATTFIRIQADIQFKDLAIKALVQHVVEPIKKSSVVMRFIARSELRKTVTLQANDVGKSYTFAKKGDLGMVFRVDDRNVIHLAGMLPDSPLRDKARVGWKLQTVNGKRLNMRSELEVQSALKGAKFPLRLTFLAKRKTKAQEEQEERGAGATLDLADDRKMMIIMIGVMNAFNQVSMFDFEWPPIFKQIAKLASQLSFNFNFFHPECSVAMPFMKKWLYFLSVPYAMLGPLTVAFIIASVVTLYKDVRGQTPAFWTKFWLLKNAYARVCCMSAILLLPFHYDQLLVPFACIERGVGLSYVAAWPETQCSLKNEIYKQMLTVSFTGTLIVMVLYAGILTCLWKSFKWQFGSRHRSRIPFYVAIVEVSTFGQRGYVGEVRERVMSNVCAAKSFDPDVKKIQERELALKAVERLGHRCRKAMELRRAGELPVGDSHRSGNAESIADRLAIIKAKRRFAQKQIWPDRPDGNVITYGWVLIVNLALRQICSLMTIKLTKGNLVVIGAGFQMMIFAGNITLLVIFRPYKSDRITQTESIMLTALFSILWCAVLKDLLTSHVNAHLFADVLAKVSRGIEVLAILMIVLVVVVPFYQVILIGTRFVLLFSGPDAVLNDIYMSQRMKVLREKALAEKNKISDLLETDATEDAGEDLAAALAKSLPTLDEALRRFAEQGKGRETVDLLEQRRQLTRLGRIVKSADEAKQRRIQQQLAQDAAEEEAKKEAARRAALAAQEEEDAANKNKRGAALAVGALFGATAKAGPSANPAEQQNGAGGGNGGGDLALSAFMRAATAKAAPAPV